MIVINNTTVSGGETTDSLIPVGAIVLWYGTSSALPSSYKICNGLNGTPDLRNRFIRGASISSALLTTGGATTHLHAGGTSESTGSHSHSRGLFTTGGYGVFNNTASSGQSMAAKVHYHSTSAGDTSSDGSHSHASASVSGAGSSLPSHKKLYWVKRVA